ncbi:hypothetical protein A9Q98_07115 [Thalassotalea sp. 42_200_T64]|nr:hypothetical protein A9Q98_07115 [Thalassotalea sp. 42_200_T64]
MLYRNYDLKNLEREYSPSSCVDDINIYIKQYVERSDKATQLAEQQGKVLKNLSYGDSADEMLDLFLPTVGNTKKLQVYIHGGYWQELSKDESSFAATNFQRHGCYFAVINYSLAPNATMTEIVEQNRRALAWLFENAERLGFNGNEIYLSGSSAGAHLAMMMLQTHWPDYLNNTQASAKSNLVKGVCAVSGIYDIEPIALTYINEPLQLSAQEIDRCSPLRHDVINHCPVILAYGEDETAEFKRQTAAIAALVFEDVFEIPERNHFDVIIDLADDGSWLCQQVFQQMAVA